MFKSIYTVYAKVAILMLWILLVAFVCLVMIILNKFNTPVAILTGIILIESLVRKLLAFNSWIKDKLNPIAEAT